MSPLPRRASGIYVKTVGGFYGAVVVGKNYYYPPRDATHNGWIIEWLYNNEGIQEGRDEMLGEKLKRDIELFGVERFEEMLAKLIGSEPFSITLTAQDFNDRWKVCESDNKAFTFFIPSIDCSKFEFSVLNTAQRAAANRT